MAWRKGYSGEYKAKQELSQLYGSSNVLKLAIAQIGADYMVFKQGRIVLLVEVKETNADKYYASKRELLQFVRIKAFAQEHKCDAQLWIYYRKGKGKEMEKEIRDLTNNHIQRE